MWRKSVVCTCTIALLSAIPGSARGDFFAIYGGPTFNSSTQAGFLAEGAKVGSGFAVGYATKHDAPAGIDLGDRVFRWDSSGSPATEYAHLGTDVGGYTQSVITSLNDAGIAVGISTLHSATFGLQGERAVRWNTLGTIATELDNLGTDSNGYTLSTPISINNSNMTVGYATKYDATVYLGFRAVRWDPGGTAVTELDNLGTDADGFTGTYAAAINDAGTIAGIAGKYDSGIDLGDRAVRWAAGGTAITELDVLSTSNAGSAFANVSAINASGVIVGNSDQYVAGAYKGIRAVRWDPSGTAVTELGHLGENSENYTSANAVSVNSAGTAVGYSEKYDATVYRGFRAVRWDASGTAATELGDLGANALGVAYDEATVINDLGIAVGYADEYDISGNFIADRAVLWGQDGIPIRLIDLIDPASGWLNLSYATDISNDNWVAGVGVFDPDGPGGLDAYDRLFLMQVPEPAGWVFAILGMVMPRIGRRVARGI